MQEWPIFDAGSCVGYSEAACPRTNRPNGRSPASSSILAVPDGWKGEYHKVTWPSLFLLGVGGVTLTWFPVSGDSRKMNGAGDSGRFSLFLLDAGYIYLSRSRWDCVAVCQHNVAPDAEVIPRSTSIEWCKKSGTRDRFAKVALYEVLDAPSDMELINGSLTMMEGRYAQQF